MFCKQFKCKTTSNYIKSCFTVVVHVGFLREKTLIKSNMRKAFYNKIFCPKEKEIIHHCLWFKLSAGVV